MKKSIRICLLAAMFSSMAFVLAWAGWIGWREWPGWRAVREMRAAVEANEPGRFLDAIERVDSLGVAQAAADEIAPLGQHPDPRVRIYAVMARTVLGPRGPTEAKELIELFDDPDEDMDVRRMAARCLVLYEEQAREVVASLNRAIVDIDDPRCTSALVTLFELGPEITGPLPVDHLIGSITEAQLKPNMTQREMAEFLAVRTRIIHGMINQTLQEIKAR